MVTNSLAHLMFRLGRQNQMIALCLKEQDLHERVSLLCFRMNVIESWHSDLPDMAFDVCLTFGLIWDGTGPSTPGSGSSCFRLFHEATKGDMT